MTAFSQCESVYKVGYVEPDAREFRFDDVFSREDRKGTPLLWVGTAGSEIEVLKKLLQRMPEPFWILYVLVVSRGEGEPGRYQSAQSLLRVDVEEFLNLYSNFLESDARHNVWIKSEEGPALLVLDAHGLIYCYGPVDEWADELLRSGWQEVPRGSIRLPDPHQHHYHEIFDDDARRVLKDTEWIHSPLQEQDE